MITTEVTPLIKQIFVTLWHYSSDQWPLLSSLAGSQSKLKCLDHHTVRRQSICIRERQGRNPIGKALVRYNMGVSDFISQWLHYTLTQKHFFQEMTLFSSVLTHLLHVHDVWQHSKNCKCVSDVTPLANSGQDDVTCCPRTGPRMTFFVLIRLFEGL